MPEKQYTTAELNEIASEIIDMLRPKHLRVFEIRQVLNMAMEKTDCIVLREKSE